MIDIIDSNIISNILITESVTRNNMQLSSNKINLNGNDLNLTSNHKDKHSTLTKIKVTLSTDNYTYNSCNCRKVNKINCPLQGKYLIKNVDINYKCNIVVNC